MSKLVLDNEFVYEDFFDETRLLGIIAPIKNYQFCWHLNNKLGFEYKLNTDCVVHLRKRNRDYFFNIYESKEDNSFLSHFLYHNQYDGEYLLPEFKHIDFLWLMKGDWVDEEKCTLITNAVRSIDGVQLVTELTNEQIKNKGNMVF